MFWWSDDAPKSLEYDLIGFDPVVGKEVLNSHEPRSEGTMFRDTFDDMRMKQRYDVAGDYVEDSDFVSVPSDQLPVGCVRGSTTGPPPRAFKPSVREHLSLPDKLPHRDIPHHYTEEIHEAPDETLVPRDRLTPFPKGPGPERKPLDLQYLLVNKDLSLEEEEQNPRDSDCNGFDEVKRIFDNIQAQSAAPLSETLRNDSAVQEDSVALVQTACDNHKASKGKGKAIARNELPEPGPLLVKNSDTAEDEELSYNEFIAHLEAKLPYDNIWNQHPDEIAKCWENSIGFGKHKYPVNTRIEWLAEKLLTELSDPLNLWYNGRAGEIIGDHPLVLTHPKIRVLLQKKIATVGERARKGFPADHDNYVNEDGTVVQRGFTVTFENPATADALSASYTKRVFSWEQPTFSQASTEELQRDPRPARQELPLAVRVTDPQVLRRIQEQRRQALLDRTRAELEQRNVQPTRVRSDLTATRARGAAVNARARRHTDPPHDIMIVREDEAENAIASDSEKEESEQEEEPDHGEDTASNWSSDTLVVSESMFPHPGSAETEADDEESGLMMPTRVPPACAIPMPSSRVADIPIFEDFPLSGRPSTSWLSRSPRSFNLVNMASRAASVAPRPVPGLYSAPRSVTFAEPAVHPRHEVLQSVSRSVTFAEPAIHPRHEASRSAAQIEEAGLSTLVEEAAEEICQIQQADAESDEADSDAENAPGARLQMHQATPQVQGPAVHRPALRELPTRRPAQQAHQQARRPVQHVRRHVHRGPHAQRGLPVRASRPPVDFEEREHWYPVPPTHLKRFRWNHINKKPTIRRVGNDIHIQRHSS